VIALLGKPFGRRWLRRSLRDTLASGGIATLSLALSAALVFALVAVTRGVRQQLGRELASYGANLLVLPASAPLRFGLGSMEMGPVEEARSLSEAALTALPGTPATGVETVAPALLASVELDGEPVAAAGWPLDALRRLNPLWRVSPRWPTEPNEAMIGSLLAARLRLSAGGEIEVRGSAGIERLRIVALVETGGAEDENLFLPIARLQSLTGRPGEASFALVRARMAERAPEAAAKAVADAVPESDVRTLSQVARAEASLLAKVGRLLLLVTLAITAATAFTVSGTLGVLLLGRRQEIGLYLALGAGPARIRSLLLAEAAATGLAGGVAGCALGLGAAEAIALSVFGSSVPFSWLAAPAALLTALALAVGAAAWPVRRALRVNPCDTLRAP
jgi:putative ABC transport system permease protein